MPALGTANRGDSGGGEGGVQGLSQIVNKSLENFQYTGMSTCVLATALVSITRAGEAIGGPATAGHIAVDTPGFPSALTWPGGMRRETE